MVSTGLHGVVYVGVSPDGRHAYATAFDGDAVSTLARNPTTGALAPVTCVKDVRTAPSTSNCPVKARD